jgi:hypothetical protein
VVRALHQAGDCGMKATAFLPADPQRAHVIWSELWKNVKALTYAGHALEVEVRPERRNDPQNRRLHAMLGDIARQLDWAGSKREVDVWKRLLTSAWLRARGHRVPPYLEADEGGMRRVDGVRLGLGHRARRRIQ